MFSLFALLLLFFFGNVNSDNSLVWNEVFVRVSDGSYLYTKTLNPDSFKKKKTFPLLLLHGLAESETTFDHFVEEFSKTYKKLEDYTIVVVGLRGHGDSQDYDVSSALFTIDRLTLDVIEVLQYYGISSAIWMGHSLGGIVSINAAVKYAKYVYSFIAYATGPYLSSAAIERIEDEILSLSCIDHNVESGLSAQNFINLGLSNPQAFRIEIDIYKLGTSAYQKTATSLIETDYSSYTFSQNMLILSASDDSVFSPDIVNKLAKMSRGVVTTFNSFTNGHYFLYYHTDNVIKYIAQWLGIKN